LGDDFDELRYEREERDMKSCIRSARGTGLLDGMEELIEQSGYSREQILEVFIHVQANQIRTLRDEIQMLGFPEPAPPSGYGWGGLGLAGLAGFWLGGGFSRDDE
jgi:hypothetical protein